MKRRPNPALRMTRLDRVRKPRARADWLVAQCLDRLLKPDPLISAVYQQMRPDVEKVFTEELGPRTKRGRAIRQFIDALDDIHLERAR